MPKNFFGVSLFCGRVYLRDCFVRKVYSRDYPHPYLYTHTGPIGDIGLLVLPACRRYPYTLPYIYFFSFFFSLSACCVWWLGSWSLARAGPDRSRFNTSDNAYLGVS